MSQPAVIFGGPSPEHDISILTGLLAARALHRAGRTPHCLYWTKTGEWFAVDHTLEGKDFRDGVPKGSRPLRLSAGPGGGFLGEGGALRKERPLDITAAVNCCHGAPGEDGTLQGALDVAGVAHAGPSGAGAALGMDKLAFGALMASVGLPTLPRALASRADRWAAPFAGPYIVKPRFGGSSIGIEVAADAGAVTALLRHSVHFEAGAVVEPYLESADEVQIAVRTFPELALSHLLRPQRTGGHIYSYQEKYVPGEGMHAARADVDPDLGDGVGEALRGAATSIAGVARVRGVARIDFLLNDKDWYVNEINTIPGSLAKHLWIGVEFADLLAGMLDEAVMRPTTAAWTTAGADGSALTAAESIDGKLG